MPVIDKVSVLSLISDNRKHLSHATSTPHDYQSLKTLIVQKELAQELDALEKIAQEKGDFALRFKERCKARALQNEGSCLSFSEMPEGIVNRLYWDIAMLFDPKPSNMSELFQILMPQITEKVVIEAKVRPDIPLAHLSMRGIDVTVSTKPILTWDEEFSLHRVQDCVVVGNRLLDVKDIARFNLAMHRKYYDALSTAYPEIAARLYQHNSELRKLAYRLSILQGKGRTPFEAITTLIRELRLGSNYMTGREWYATRKADTAFALFMGYLNVLPEDIKDALMALSHDDKSFAMVIESIVKHECIQKASGQLQAIIEQSKYREFLMTNPILSNDDLKAFIKEYSSGTLATEAEDSSTSLPELFLIQILTQVKITNAIDCISLLQSFPPAYYSSLLQHAATLPRSLLSEQLVGLINDGFLNPEQQNAFYAALFKQFQKFGLFTVIIFYLCSDGALNEIGPFLSGIPKEALYSAMKVKDSEGGTLLHKVALHFKILQDFLNVIALEKRLEAVKVKDSDGNTVLHLACPSLESFNAILELYPLSDRLAAVKVKNKLGHTALHLAAKNPVVLRIILALYPLDELLDAMKAKDKYGETVLHKAISNPESSHIILSSYPIEKRLEALRQEDAIGHTVLARKVT